MSIPLALQGHQHNSPQDEYMGEPINEEDRTLTVNGIPVAVVGSATAHGGQVIQGDPTLTIG